MPRRLKGRCLLCGAHTQGDYCHAHLWAGNVTVKTELERAAIYREGVREGWRRSQNGAAA